MSAAVALEVPEVENEKVLPFIIGGTETQWGQFPSSVIIDGPNEFCGGSIVDASHVRSSKDTAIRAS